MHSDLKFNQYMHRCWELAEKSDCQKMHFGAVIVLEGKVIGEGYNHVAHPSLNDSCCLREGIQSGTRLELCNANHAEESAITNAHHNGYADLSRATLYVAGKFPDGKRLIKREPGLYCTRCARQIAIEKINDVRVPTKEGDAKLSLAEVIGTAFQFATEKKKITYEKDSE